MHPTAQRKAQDELDAVVGTDRLPTLADREKLPYVEALYLEVMRCNPIGPIGTSTSAILARCFRNHSLGLPHVLVEDDVHEGYFIPKGSMIITNVWYDHLTVPLLQYAKAA
jgi:hypothetical protein